MYRWSILWRYSSFCRGKQALGQLYGFYPIRIHLFSEKKEKIIYLITTFKNPPQQVLRNTVFFPTAVSFFSMKKQSLERVDMPRILHAIPVIHYPFHSSQKRNRYCSFKMPPLKSLILLIARGLSTQEIFKAYNILKLVSFLALCNLQIVHLPSSQTYNRSSKNKNCSVNSVRIPTYVAQII